ncbi:MAG: hypothetical protein IH978_05515 [Nitrospinae bacterium]|nr:hypothetical protein [Nitrospinota bacterium]
MIRSTAVIEVLSAKYPNAKLDYLTSSLNLDATFLITRSKDGMSLFQSNVKPIHFPGQTKEVYDVSGQETRLLPR